MRTVQVIQPNSSVIGTHELDEDKLYIALDTRGRAYKAHRIKTNGWLFLSLYDSVCGAVGEHESLRKLCEFVLNGNDRFISPLTIYEFKDFGEFVEFVKEKF